jgi:OOP family OmpA-OmpF porin
MQTVNALSVLVLAAGCGGAARPQVAAPQPIRVQQQPAPAPVTHRVERREVTEQWVELPMRILFATGRADLDRQNQMILDQAITTMRARNDVVRVRIEGHTDTRGRDGSNAQLSLERAHGVMSYLVSHGVPQSMLEAVGYGEERPLVHDNFGGDMNPAQNRRVEFSVLIRREVGGAVSYQ